MNVSPPPPRDGRSTTLAVWMPWLAAPLFCLLPIGGCAVAGSLRQAAAQAMTRQPVPGPAVANTVPVGAAAPILTAAAR